MKDIQPITPPICVETNDKGDCLMSAQYVILDFSPKPKTMSTLEFPKIKGLKWLSNEYPDLVCIKIVMENRSQAEMGIKAEETLHDMYCDLSRLAGIKDWWEKDAEGPSETECCVDFSGITQMVLVITKENLLKAWMFYKNFKYDPRNI